MTLDLTHLPTSIRERAFDGNQDRIRQVRAANWVGYARASRARRSIASAEAWTQANRMLRSIRSKCLGETRSLLR